MRDSFADSNVVIYALSTTEKAARAWEVLVPGTTISVQVLNEVLNVSRRKNGLSWPTIRDNLADLRRALKIVPVTLEVHELGLDLAERYGLSPYDAMIAAAAISANCGVLWSEDMHDGLVLNGCVTVRNPFLNH